jgi:hypothetical protein
MAITRKREVVYVLTAVDKCDRSIRRPLASYSRYVDAAHDAKFIKIHEFGAISRVSIPFTASAR